MFKAKNLFPLKFFLYPVIGVVGYSAYCYYEQQYRKNSQSSQDIKYLQKIFRTIKQTKSLRDIIFAYSQAHKYLYRYLIDPYTRNKRILDSSNKVADKNLMWTIPYEGYKLSILNKYTLQQEKKNGLFTLGFWMDLQQYKFTKIQKHEKFIEVIRQIKDYRNKKCKQYGETRSSDINSYSFYAYEECMNKTNQYYVNLCRKIDFVEKFVKNQKQ